MTRGGGETAPLVAIDARMMGYSGIGTYLRALVPRVIAARPTWRFVLVGTPGNTSLAGLVSDRVRLVPCDAGIYTIAEQLSLPGKLPRGTNVLWSPHYNIPVFSRVPLVVTVHDVCHLALPQFFEGAASRAYARGMFGAVRHQAREVIFVSDFSRQEFRRLVGEPHRATTIHSGVERTWQATIRSGETNPHARPYLLAVGGPRRHKNLGALVLAFERLCDEIDHDLIIIGNRGAPRTRDEEFLGHAARVGPRVILRDPVDDDLLGCFMRHASALVVPSLYEGFGLPALEAMAAGCACVVSRSASLPEVCADAALYFDPADPQDIANQIYALLTSPVLQDRLVRAGHDRASRFSWDTTALQTVGVLEAAIGGRSMPRAV